MASRLLSRALIGGALALIVVAAVRADRPEPLALLVAAWSVLATVEFVRLLALAEIRLNRWLVPLLSLATVTAAYVDWLPEFLIAPLAVVLLAAVATRETKPRIPVYGTFVVLYLGFLPAHLVMLKDLAVEEGFSSWLVLFPLALTWVSDTAAFAAGRLFGRHPLSPNLSPRKTIEGLLAGLLAAAALCAGWLRFFAPFDARPVWWLAVVGAGLSAVGQAGDLFESMFKRAVGVKDSSTLLGQHGGFLDRCDSLLFCIPAFYYLTRVLLSR
ncbi:hypothetical protein FJY71_00490 [candidate division WOR-3 bacterium]|nr:hypothetical protein [candidate division WOR-3 bacterium]